MHFLVVLLLVATANPYNYLVYSPVVAHSHDNYLGKLADVLTDAGHCVTYLAPLVNYRLKGKIGVKRTKDIITSEPDDALINIQNKIEGTDVGNFWTEFAGLFTQDETEALSQELCQLKHHVKSIANVGVDQKITVKFYPSRFLTKSSEVPSLWTTEDEVIRDFLGIKSFIIASSMPFDEYVAGHIGEALPLSMVPVSMSRQSDEMTFFERFWNVIEYGKTLMNEWDSVPDICFENFGLEKYNFRETIKDANFVFTNSNPILNHPRPTLPKTISIGGIVVDLEKLRNQRIPAEFDQVLNRRSKNVLVSFGSIILSSVMPDNYKKNLLNVFASMPDVTFIWKYETEQLQWAAGVDNVYFSKWVPQTTLLADERLTMFITHGGLGSTTELSYLGKPALAIPLFADQDRNAKMMQRHGTVEVLDKTLLGDFDAVRSAVNKVINDVSYKMNAESLRHQLETQPFDPKDIAVKHAEFAARFPSSSMNSASVHLNFFQYYLLDVFTFVAFISTVTLLVSFYTVRSLLKLISTSKLKYE